MVLHTYLHNPYPIGLKDMFNRRTFYLRDANPLKKLFSSKFSQIDGWDNAVLLCERVGAEKIEGTSCFWTKKCKGSTTHRHTPHPTMNLRANRVPSPPPLHTPTHPSLPTRALSSTATHHHIHTSTRTHQHIRTSTRPHQHIDTPHHHINTSHYNINTSTHKSIKQ